MIEQYTGDTAVAAASIYDTLEVRIRPYIVETNQLTSNIYSTVLSVSDKLDTLSDGLTTLSGKLDVQTESLESIVSKLTQIASSVISSDTHLDHIETLQTTWLPALGDNISTLNSNVMSVYTSVSNTLAEVMDVNTSLTSIEASANSAALDVDSIFSFLTNENGPIYATALISSNISAKLDDLHVTTDFTDTNIVSAINNLASLFSLGETQTIEAQGVYFCSLPEGEVQSISVTCPDDTGYVVFSEYACPLGLVQFENAQLYVTPSTLANFGYLEVLCDMASLRGTGSYMTGGSYSFDIVLLDSSGTPIPLKRGDMFRPTATVDRWEISRLTGETIEIADCIGLPDSLRFGDIFFRSARVPVRDLIAAPSLFTSYLRQVGYNQYDGSGCQVFNFNGSPLTVEYVNPSSLLNWYANRQNDFRYWLDTRLSNLPVAQPTDLTALQATLTTLENTLSSAEYFAPVITGIDTVNANVTALNTNLTTNLDSLVDKLQIVVDNSTTNVENTIVNITNDNDAFNVFYITGEDGDTQSVTDFTGELTGASGKLLSLLYRLVFSSALDTVDDDLDNFEDFFTSQEPVTDTASYGADGTSNEVVSVWDS